MFYGLDPEEVFRLLYLRMRYLKIISASTHPTAENFHPFFVKNTKAVLTYSIKAS